MRHEELEIDHYQEMPPTPHLTEELQVALQGTYVELSKHPNFPTLFCLEASNIMRDRHGLFITSGHFQGDKYSPGRSVVQTHNWLMTADGSIVDPTAVQFNLNLHRPFSWDTLPIIKPGDPEYARYTPLETSLKKMKTRGIPTHYYK